MLNDRGGFESDLTALRLSDEVYRLYVGTSAVKRDLAWLGRHLEAGERVALTDETEDHAVIALMGMEAKRIVDVSARVAPERSAIFAMAKTGSPACRYAPCACLTSASRAGS